MIKEKRYSAHNDLKTGFFCKFFFVLGIIFLVIYLLGFFIPQIPLSGTLLGTILAFAILFLGGSLLLYFFSCQFTKLSQIAEDIENDETLIDDEEETEEQPQK